MKRILKYLQPIKAFFIRNVICRLGFHDWERMDNDTIPEVKEGQMVNMIRLHKCKHCGKETMIGSGWIC